LNSFLKGKVGQAKCVLAEALAQGKPIKDMDALEIGSGQKTVLSQGNRAIGIDREASAMTWAFEASYIPSRQTGRTRS
jgi:hypothetical protein